MSEEEVKSGKPKQLIDDRCLTFAERYGYQPLPDVSNHELCKEFRDAVYFTVNPDIERSIDSDDFMVQINRAPASFDAHPNGVFWEKITSVIQARVLGMKSNELLLDAKEVSLLIGHLINDGHFSHVLSFCELILREAESTETIFYNLTEVFAKQLAPYAIDDSTEPICIIPLDVPESGRAVVGALEDIHHSGVIRAHQCLRDAAAHINTEQYSDAIADSVHAVEAIAREMTGKRTLGPALANLRKQGLIDHEALKVGMDRLYDYASDTNARHGQPTAKAQSVKQTRDEALLIFSICAAIAGHLARKKIQMEACEK